MYSPEEQAAERSEFRYWLGVAAKVVGGLIVTLFALIVLWGLIGPQLRLYRANTEKEALVRQARAERDAAVLLAEAEVERSKGVAESNEIIAGSIDEQYLRYLFIQNLKGNQEQVIYVPTEANLPILEAGKR